MADRMERMILARDYAYQVVQSVNEKSSICCNDYLTACMSDIVSDAIGSILAKKEFQSDMIEFVAKEVVALIVGKEQSQAAKFAYAFTTLMKELEGSMIGSKNNLERVKDRTKLENVKVYAIQVALKSTIQNAPILLSDMGQIVADAIKFVLERQVFHSKKLVKLTAELEKSITKNDKSDWLKFTYSFIVFMEELFRSGFDTRLTNTIRCLLNKITPTTEYALTNEFLDHKVYESSCLPEIVSIFFDISYKEPKFSPLLARLCQMQVREELRINNNVSSFHNATLIRAEDTFTIITKNQEDLIKEKEAEIEAEIDEKKKKEKKIELLEIQSEFRRSKFGNIMFIGHLFLQNLISAHMILFCVVDLLKSLTEQPENSEGYKADDESVECAIRLIETIGKGLQEEATSANRITAEGGRPQSPNQTLPLDMTLKTLEGAIPIVSNRIKFMIMDLADLRNNGWVSRKAADEGPRKLDEIKERRMR